MFPAPHHRTASLTRHFSHTWCTRLRPWERLPQPLHNPVYRTPLKLRSVSTQRFSLNTGEALLVAPVVAKRLFTTCLDVQCSIIKLWNIFKIKTLCCHWEHKPARPINLEVWKKRGRDDRGGIREAPRRHAIRKCSHVLTAHRCRPRTGSIMSLHTMCHWYVSFETNRKRMQLMKSKLSFPSQLLMAIFSPVTGLWSNRDDIIHAGGSG